MFLNQKNLNRWFTKPNEYFNPFNLTLLNQNSADVIPKFFWEFTDFNM